MGHVDCHVILLIRWSADQNPVQKIVPQVSDCLLEITDRVRFCFDSKVNWSVKIRQYRVCGATLVCTLPVFSNRDALLVRGWDDLTYHDNEQSHTMKAVFITLCKASENSSDSSWPDPTLDNSVVDRQSAEGNVEMVKSSTGWRIAPTPGKSFVSINLRWKWMNSSGLGMHTWGTSLVLPETYIHSFLCEHTN